MTLEALTQGPVVRQFVEGWCKPSKGDDLLVLRPWQVALLDDLFAIEPATGLRRYREALIGMPRKNGKSTLGAALALYGLIVDSGPGAEVYSVAGDRMQAGIVFREARAMVEAHSELASRCRVYRSHIEVPETGAVYRVLSADATRAQGLSPSLVLFDEVHVQPNEDLWAAMTLGSGTQLEPLVVGITTAGFNRASLCWRLYDHGRRVLSGERDDPTFFFRWWEPANPDADWKDPAVWAEANPAYDDFLHRADFEAAVRSTPENQFRRYRLNQWTTTDEAWLPHGAWAARSNADRYPKVATDGRGIPTGGGPGPDEPIAVALDGAWTGDSVALIGATLEDDPHLFVIGHWEPDAAHAVEEQDVDDAMRETFARWKVVKAGADPFLWRQTIAAWRRSGLPVMDWPTNALRRMVPACSEFYRATMEGRLTHDGDPRLARHIANAVVRDDRNGRRITKASSGLKVDLAVAAVMAYDLARQPKPGAGRRVHSF